jgi:Autophagy protein Apg5
MFLSLCRCCCRVCHICRAMHLKWMSTLEMQLLKRDALCKLLAMLLCIAFLICTSFMRCSMSPSFMPPLILCGRTALDCCSWFEDSSTGQPIRWHLPIGVLHDMRAAERKCLPWRLTVHFHRFPHKQVQQDINTHLVLNTINTYSYNRVVLCAVERLAYSTNSFIRVAPIAGDTIRRRECST